MRFELILLIITGFIVANIYTDGKYLKMAMTWKKYYQMAGVVLGAFMLYILIKKNPLRAQQIISTSNEYIKYLPVDSETSSMLSPILDFTSKQNFFNNQSNNQYNSIDGGNYNHPVLSMPNNTQTTGETRMLNSGKKATKRSVSETKKKFVASRQNWKCGDCQDQLSAWFEVDHKVRLEYGGSNHIDNLVALCRECHGKKTTIENL
jgi:5-methylcytosine-specific restriction endonuclease McrA|uniref:HNH nuclease domain-containing protein n=1 Tax=viral metagenome TaxID=1070528 RepID=A0A6C0H280_9ZZZZ